MESGVKLINVDMNQDDFLVKFEELGRVEAKPHEIETYTVEPGDILLCQIVAKTRRRCCFSVLSRCTRTIPCLNVILSDCSHVRLRFYSDI